MKKFEIGQKFWDEKNCTEIEVVKFGGTGYYCKTIDAADGIEGYQWFKASELISIK